MESVTVTVHNGTNQSVAQHRNKYEEVLYSYRVDMGKEIDAEGGRRGEERERERERVCVCARACVKVLLSSSGY